MTPSDSREGQALDRLVAASREVAEGRYESARKIFDLTREEHSSVVRRVAEAFGLMAVKIEAREFRLEQMLNEIYAQHEEILKAMRTRNEFSTMACFIILALSSYTLVFAIVKEKAHLVFTDQRLAVLGITLGMFLLLGAMAVYFIRKHRPPPETYGWTLVNWRRSLAESLLFSAVILLLLLPVRWLLVRYAPEYLGQPVIDFNHWDGPLATFLYFMLSPVQELIGRGFLQSSIERFITGRHSALLAILLTSFMFGIIHLHFAISAGVFAALGSMAFGAIYVRHRTLLGPSVAHFIVGTFAFGPLRLIG